MGKRESEKEGDRKRKGGNNFGQVLTFNFANEVLETCAKFAITVRGHRTQAKVRTGMYERQRSPTV